MKEILENNFYIKHRIFFMKIIFLIKLEKKQEFKLHKKVLLKLLNLIKLSR